MRATRVKKYRTRPPRRPCNAKKAKKQFSECWCREVFVFVAAVAVRCHAICTTVGKDYMTRNASRTNRVKQISTCWCRESLGSEICDVWFECGRQESKNIGQGRQEDRAMRRKQKNNFPNAGVEKFLSSSRQWRCVVTPFAQLLEKTI